MNTELDSLEIRVQDDAEKAASGLDKLTRALGALKSAAKGGAGLNSTANQLTKLSKALSTINISSDGISKLAEALKPLQSIQKSPGLTSTVSALKQIPAITKSLSSQELQKFGAQIRLVTKYLEPLAAAMEKVSRGFAAFPIRIQKIIQGNTGLAASNKKAASSFGFLSDPITNIAAKFASYEYILRRVVGFLADCVMSINEYVENVNLFQVAMGDYYDEAFAYAQLVGEKLGVDPSQWMRTQGVFQSMANGFGISKEQAYALSEGLTELSYDISSLYNEDIESSAQRLQSALAGEIEPIRRLGISITEASLKEYALSKGISESVESMTEQEKALLRSMKLMESASQLGAIGDFAKTLESPANALRVLNQQITQFKRAIGSVMLPVLVQILPYIQAFVSLLTDAISALAAFVGFTMPEWDANDWGTGVVTGADEAEDALSGAAAAAKELKNATLGIDELSILAPTGGASGAAGGSGGVSGWADDLEIPDIWDKDALREITTRADELKQKLEPVLHLAGLIGATMLGWKIGNAVFDGLRNLKVDFGDLKTALKKQLGVLSISAGLVIGIDNIRAILSGEYANTSPQSFIKTALWGVLTGLGLVAVAGASVLAIPIAVVAAFVITDLVVNWDEYKAMWKSQLGALKSLFTGDLEAFWDDTTQAFLSYAKIDGWAQKLGKALVGDDVWNSAIGYLENGGNVKAVFDFLGTKVEEGLAPIVTLIQNTWGGIVSFFSEAVPDWWSTNVEPWFTRARWDSMLRAIPDAVKSVWDATVGQWATDLSTWWTKNVAPWFTLEKWKTLLSNVSTAFSSMWSGIVAYFKTALPKWWNADISPWFTVSKWKDLGTKAISGLMEGLNSIKTKLTSWASNAWSSVKNKFGALRNNISNALSGIGGAISISIPGFASGGYPEAGQLFLANEAGPELVGQVGRRTAVANSDQIVEGIAYGVSSANESLITAVYAAAQQVIRAVEAGGDVYMDGYKVGQRTTASQNRQNRVYGKTLQNV